MQVRRVKRRWVVGFWALVLPFGTVVCGERACAEPQQQQTQAPDIEKTFEAANKLLEEQHYSEALAQYKTLLATQPDDAAVLWNAGLAASLGSNYKEALPLWQHLKTIDPKNGKVRAKLLQVYQATGDRKARAEERAALIALRKSGKDPALAKEPCFCCDRFTTKGLTVYAYDYFALTGKFARRYDFLILKPDGTQDYRLTLESDEADTEMARELHEIKANERIFTLDGYYEQGRVHKTFNFYQKEISYDEAKADVMRAVEGKTKVLSSSTRPATEKR
jgi:tetratricopeptide (TPR) repeat protein